MAKDQPNQAVAPESAGQLPSYEDFVREMKPQLTLVSERKLESLLRSIYQAAEDKINLEGLRRLRNEELGGLRQSRTSMRAVEKLLGKASSILTSAKNEHGEALKIIEERVKGEEFEFTFDDLLGKLRDAVEMAHNFQLECAGSIHPDLREGNERLLANQKLPGDIVAGSISPSNHPARPRSPDIDHWFIGRVVKLLDSHSTSAGEKIPRYDVIISRLFEIAFGKKEKRSQENIRTEIRRQTKVGAPAYDVLSDHLLKHNRAPKLWDKSDSDAGPAPKIVRTKRKL